MGFKALFYAYILGGVTLIPLVAAALIFITIYTSVPVGDPNLTKIVKGKLEADGVEGEKASSDTEEDPPLETNDIPRTRKGWLTMRRTFEESNLDGGYVTLVRSFLDARSKDPRRSRPKDMWYVVLKGKVLYLYEDEEMTECEAAVELSSYDVVIFPEGLLDGELFAKRNAIYLKPKKPQSDKHMPTITKEMKLETEDTDDKAEQNGGNLRKKERETEKKKETTKEETLNPSTPWFIFVRSNIEMEDWYFSLIHASDHPTKTPTLAPLQGIFQASDMNHLVATLDEQPDVIPMRWLNALFGRIFFSYYRTHTLEAYIIGRLMKKLSKVKRPAFLTDIVVTEVSVGNKAPTFSKPMLKELTKEGDASMEVHLQYKGEFRITIEATATINLSARFKSYTVKLVLAAVLKELEGNLLVKVKRPPSNRVWYAFTQTPRMVLEVEPIVSDRQITWGMILSTIESRLKEIIQESVVLPNMDDIAFFESSRYQHRGGIWQDASRHERQPSLLSEHVLDETLSTSAPALDTRPSSLVEDPLPVQQQQSLSGEEISTEALSTSPSPPEVSTAPPITEGTSSPPRLQNRRRSWFSSVRSDDLSSIASKDFYADEEGDSDSKRGRSAESEKTSVSSPRSQSTPHKQDSTETLEQELDDSYLQTHLSPHSARRSSSQHSSARGHTKSTSIDSSRSAPDPSTSTSPKTSTNSNTPSSPNSFLSTLKSRAGDKQALSNTAKEAMRKWGVNWGGLRKDSNGGGGEDISDHGSIGSTISSRLRTDSNKGVAQKARTSYAEVRAAVAERKGKDKLSGADDGGGGSDRSRSSSPVVVPDGGESRGQMRVVSNPSTTGLSPSALPGSVAHSSSSGSSSSRRLSTASESKKSSPGISRVNTDSDEPRSTHAPIHVQPQAKMMTIPGIHASHRGEVMSMGYVAPPPPPPVAPSEGKSSIQSVYRLWKNPAPPAHENSSQQQDKEMSQTQGSGQPQTQTESGSDENNTSTALPPTPQTPPKMRPVPPPLPPRSTPVAVSASRPSPSPNPPSSASSSSDIPPGPSASQTLKSIVHKDERTRASIENISQTISARSQEAGKATTPTKLETTNGDSDLGSDNSREESSTSTTNQPNATIAPSMTPNPNPGPPLPPRRVPV